MHLIFMFSLCTTPIFGICATLSSIQGLLLPMFLEFIPGRLKETYAGTGESNPGQLYLKQVPYLQYYFFSLIMFFVKSDTIIRKNIEVQRFILLVHSTRILGIVKLEAGYFSMSFVFLASVCHVFLHCFDASSSSYPLSVDRKGYVGWLSAKKCNKQKSCL